MSTSMLDEVQVPPEPWLFICPCCRFSFQELARYIAHCETMKATIDAALARARARK